MRRHVPQLDGARALAIGLVLLTRHARRPAPLPKRLRAPLAANLAVRHLKWLTLLWVPVLYLVATNDFGRGPRAIGPRRW